MNPSSHRTLGALLLSVLAMSCSSAPDTLGTRSGGPGQDAVLMGAWGGPHAALAAVPAGATLEFDCAHGRIDEPVALDAQQRFEVAGLYVQEHGGPAAPPDETGQPARYAGQVNAQQLTLTVTIAATGESQGPFVLDRGATPRLTQCF